VNTKKKKKEEDNGVVNKGLGIVTVWSTCLLSSSFFLRKLGEVVAIIHRGGAHTSFKDIPTNAPQNTMFVCALPQQT